MPQEKPPCAERPGELAPPVTCWNDADLGSMSWYDNHVHSLHLIEGRHGSGELVLDLDYILRWIQEGGAFEASGFEQSAWGQVRISEGQVLKAGERLPDESGATEAPRQGWSGVTR